MTFQVMGVQDIDFDKLREVFPELPLNLLSVDIHAELNELPVIKCEFNPSFDPKSTDGS